MADDFYSRAFFTVLGGALSAGCGFWAASRKRKRDGKDLFRSIVSLQIGRLPKEDGMLEFYRENKTELRDGVYRVRQFLSDCETGRIEKLWSEYDEIKPDDLKVIAGERIDAKLHELANDAQYKTPREIMLFYLRAFYELTK